MKTSESILNPNRVSLARKYSPRRWVHCIESGELKPGIFLLAYFYRESGDLSALHVNPCTRHDFGPFDSCLGLFAFSADHSTTQLFYVTANLLIQVPKRAKRPKRTVLWVCITCLLPSVAGKFYILMFIICICFNLIVYTETQPVTSLVGSDFIVMSRVEETAYS